jgi:acetyl-CoA carboxylase carboxyltransferase component
MGLEGAVELGFRKELDAAPAGAERDALARAPGGGAICQGQGAQRRATLEIDAVIDPAETRRWLSATLASAKPALPGGRFIDPW